MKTCGTQTETRITKCQCRSDEDIDRPDAVCFPEDADADHVPEPYEDAEAEYFPDLDEPGTLPHLHNEKYCVTTVLQFIFVLQYVCII